MTEPDLERQLIHDLASVRHVQGVELNWSPGLTVKVHMDAMDWDAREIVLGLVGVYGRDRARRDHTIEYIGGISVRFTIPEPTDFTEALVLP